MAYFLIGNDCRSHFSTLTAFQRCSNAIPTLIAELPAFLPTLLAASAVVSHLLVHTVAERLRRLNIARFMTYTTLGLWIILDDRIEKLRRRQQE